MDSKVMDVIEKAVAALPPPVKNKVVRWRQYEDAKQQLAKLATTWDEHEQLCRAIARRYRL